MPQLISALELVLATISLFLIEFYSMVLHNFYFFSLYWPDYLT